MDVEFADPTYTVKELKTKIARIGLKLPAKGSGKDGRLVRPPQYTLSDLRPEISKTYY